MRIGESDGASGDPNTRAGQLQIAAQAAQQYSISPQTLWGVYGTESTFGTSTLPGVDSGENSADAAGPFQFGNVTGGPAGNSWATYGDGVPSDVYKFSPACFAAANYLSVLGADTQPDSPATVQAINNYNGNGGGTDPNTSYAQSVFNFGKQYTSSGGTVGLGGTGATPNTPNTPSAAPFYVSDSSNPDGDYWTAINNYTQTAYWYCFSDGEYLYIADGYEIMQQPPIAAIYRLSPNVLQWNFTWDNTAFQYASTHAKKARIQRKTTLAKITSPVEGTINWVCDIDAIRAGDIVQLIGFGEAIDGPWLVGDCTRSIFQPDSQLTLVPPIQPQPVSDSTSTLTGAQASSPGSGTVIAAMIAAATKINNAKLPYVWGGGRPKAGVPSIGQPGPGFNGTTVGFDCAGAVAGVLHAGGLWPATFSGSDITIIQQLKEKSLILSGKGSGNPECTLFENPGVHIFMSLNGQYWGTADGGGTTTQNGGSGGAWLTYGSNVASYTAYHVPQALLEDSVSSATV